MTALPRPLSCFARGLIAIFALGWTLLLAAADRDYGLAPVRIAWAMAGSVALVALVIMLQQPRHDQLSTQEREAYAELVTLDETLAVAQPLMDGETLDALLLFTTNNGGRI